MSFAHFTESGFEALCDSGIANMQDNCPCRCQGGIIPSSVFFNILITFTVDGIIRETQEANGIASLSLSGTTYTAPLRRKINDYNDDGSYCSTRYVYADFLLEYIPVNECLPDIEYGWKLELYNSWAYLCDFCPIGSYNETINQSEQPLECGTSPQICFMKVSLTVS